MKNFNFITVLLLATLMLFSCEEKLETIPNDRISTEIFWKTDEDATLGANAVYTYMVENADHYISWDGMTDIGYTHQPQSAESFILQGQFDALNSRVSNDWNKAYAGIRAANVFLENVDNVETSKPELIERLKGEVRTLRAYFYMNLASLFGDVPLVTQELSLSESQQVTQTPVSQVWDFVSSELTESADLLPLTQPEKGRITKGAALSIKARAMLYAGRFQEAADAAEAVMDLDQYGLFSSYKDLFSYSAEGNEEIILDIQFLDDAYPNNVFNILAQQSLNSRSYYVPTKKLVDSYEMQNGKNITDPTSGFDETDPYADRDPRLEYSVYVPGDELLNGATFDPRPFSTTGDAVGSTFVVSPTGFNVKKYVNAEDLTDPTNCGINFILIRFPEVLLTYAEAKIELNQIDGSVYDAINAIRQRPDVNMPAITSGKSQEQMRDIVRHEREVELAFEGLRYLDIRRWKIGDEVMPGKVYGITYMDQGGDLQTVEVTGWENFFSERNYLWPIPQTELDLNSNLTQNPGW